MREQSCLGEFIRYISLSVMGMVGLSCYILADTFFIARGLGTNGLAALNLAIPIYSFVHGSGLMVGMGCATRYAVFKGQRAQKASDQVFTGGVWVAVVLALFFVLCGIFFSGELTRMVGAQGEVEIMTRTYLRVILLFAPSFIMNDLMISFVRNDGNPRLSMFAMLGGSLSNIVLDYIFIFPMGMGILGAVLATGGAPVISMAILSRHFLRNKNGFHFLRESPDWRILAGNISLGVPSLITELSAGLVILIFNGIILNLAGNTGVAAYGVIANISLVVIAVYTGISQGVQPLVSRAYGGGDKDSTKRLFRYAIVTVLFLSVAIYGIMFWEADPITRIFNHERDRKLQEIAVEGIRVYFTAIPFAGFNIVLSQFFTATEKAVPAQLISVIRGFVLIIPAAFMLSFAAGMKGVWLAFPVTELMVCILGMGLYRAVAVRSNKFRNI
ncbi:MAG: MATE family efflux transporter [Lachnospiraceae bacterium]|jgi:putative MATE family efflux protein|nr:MATE family efflux transporter [Lachnospiraceae bacterium]